MIYLLQTFQIEQDETQALLVNCQQFVIDN
jgi:hypothetical protein